MIRTDTEQLGKLLSGYDGLNKTRPAGNKAGFSGPEATALTAFLSERISDFVSVVSEPKEKVPAWYVIDEHTNNVTTGTKKNDVIAEWMTRYSIPVKSRTQHKFLPPAVVSGDVAPVNGMNAYSYSAPLDLNTRYGLLLIPGAFLVAHLGEDRAEQVKAAAEGDGNLPSADVNAA